MNSGTKAAKFSALAGLATLAIMASGCAGGGLLDRSIADADLPTDSPANPYPTAIRNGSNQAPSQSPASNASSQKPANEAHPRHDPPQPLVTPLAVIPPEFVRAPPATARAIPPPANDVRQTLVDLTPATNWSPPSVAQRIDADTTHSAAPPNSNVAGFAASKSAAGAVVSASVTDAEAPTKADS